jgi:hypothetical protein
LLEHTKRDDEIEGRRYEKKGDPVHGALIPCCARLLRSVATVAPCLS